MPTRDLCSDGPRGKDSDGRQGRFCNRIVRPFVASAIMRGAEKVADGRLALGDAVEDAHGFKGPTQSAPPVERSSPQPTAPMMLFLTQDLVRLL